MKKLMILGAGVYQAPLIRKARKMGISTVAVSVPGNYPGFALADKICELDTRDSEGILKAAEKEKIDGICTAGTDVAVASIGYVCDRMGLPGISEKAADTVTDKWKMKAAFAAGGVSTAEFRKVCTEEEAAAAAEELGYPVCVKAVDRSGSRGVRKASGREELRDAWEAAREATDRDYILVEQYITAHEIGVDGFISGGKPVFLAPHDKFLHRAGGVSVPAGHRFPYRCGEREAENIRSQITRAIAATGMDRCPFNADVFVRDGQVWVIEIGGRSGATCIPELLSVYSGYSYYERIIRAALGEAVDFPEVRGVPCMAKLLFSEKGGILKHVNREMLKLLEQRGMRWQLDYGEGDVLPAMRNGTDRIGHLIAPTEDETQFDRHLEWFRRALTVDASGGSGGKPVKR